MRLQSSWLPLLMLGAVLLSHIEARRIRVHHEPEEQETIQYYAAEPQDEEEPAPRQRVVLVSTADQYNGLYGQPTAASRSSSQDNYIPSSRKALAAIRTKESAKTPPVQTIRNYNKVNDDGSFTFGYEAADGSFKEETRGTDCVVRGKYGYIDPDGNKREFTYVSGNPCDPNAPKEEVEQEQESEPESGVANYPTRPIRPIRPVTVAPKPAVTLFQNTYDQSEEEQPEPEQVLKSHQPIRRPTYITRPQYVQQTASEDAHVYQRPQIVPSTTPTSLLLHKQSINITPRPASATPSARTQLPATTYRPQLLQVSVTPRPSLLYATKHLQSPAATAVPSRGNLDFDAEFQKFQQENNILAPTPTPKTVLKANKPVGHASGNPIYSSALVFDPSSGQYNNQLYQTLPQTEGDFSLNQRIQPYVQQPQRTVLNLQQLQRQSPLYTRPAPSQETYQQQQAGLQFQNSAHLYAQQQRARLQQQQQQQQAQSEQQRQPVQQQPVYYIQPSVDQPLVSGQIDAFLRGHNIQF